MDTTQKKRMQRLKFDQEWKDAITRLPVHYQEEIYRAIEAYQHDLTVLEISKGVPTTIFMLIMPTIRRRYRARINSRKARERKRAAKRCAATVESASKSHNESTPMQETVIADERAVHCIAPSNRHKKPRRSTMERLLRNAVRHGTRPHCKS